MPSNEEGIVLSMWAANLTDACNLPSAQGGLPKRSEEGPLSQEKRQKRRHTRDESPEVCLPGRVREGVFLIKRLPCKELKRSLRVTGDRFTHVGS